MMMYGQRAANLRKDVLHYIKSELSRKEFEIGSNEDTPEDEEDESIYHFYCDDFTTEYRLIKAYKEDDLYYVKGTAHNDNGDEYEFELEYLPLDILCEIADKIFTEPLKHLPDDFRGTN